MRGDPVATGLFVVICGRGVFAGKEALGAFRRGSIFTNSFSSFHKCNAACFTLFWALFNFFPTSALSCFDLEGSFQQ